MIGIQTVLIDLNGGESFSVKNIWRGVFMKRKNIYVWTIMLFIVIIGLLSMYYSDIHDVLYRNRLIAVNNFLDYYNFQSFASEDVVIGKEGWFFYCSETDYNPVEQSLGCWKYTREQMQNIADNLVAADEILENQGIEFVLFIAPNKESVYMDKLPDYYQVCDEETSTIQLIKYLKENTSIRIVYPLDELMEKRENQPNLILYHQLDTHWNNAGAYVGAECLMNELGIKIPPLEEVLLEPYYSSKGDLMNMLNISVENGDVDYKLEKISELETITEKWDEKTEFIYRTPGADERKLFVVRDSFSKAMVPIIAAQFENCLFVLRDVFQQQQIINYDTDIFVLETVERYLPVLGVHQYIVP